MDQELYLKIAKWRKETASGEGMEEYRVISSQAVEGIAESKPETDEELLLVKGIAEKKLAKYGSDLLAIVNEHLGTPAGGTLFKEPEEKSDKGESREPEEKIQEKIFSVGDFLELLNIGLKRSRGKVRGEISSVDIRDRYIFFGMKDAVSGAMMSVMMWRNDYDMSGVALEEGMEVVVTGFPEIYKPMGKFSFKAGFVELAGEGALKKAYEELKKKLEAEGVFSEDRKKELPKFPERVGVITSKTGAVIHDFLNNLGKFGYQISFFDSRVEGVQAVRDLLAGLEYFKKSNNIDVLVIIRGGGSLESLQAFNNEALIREMLDCPFPVVAGIGHDKDVPLVSLTADVMVSTPTAAAKMLDAPWNEARAKVALSREKIFSSFDRVISKKKFSFSKNMEILRRGVEDILRKVRRLEQGFEVAGQKFSFAIVGYKRALGEYEKKIDTVFARAITQKNDLLISIGKILHTHSPKRQLELGYSIVSSGGKVVRKKEDVKTGDQLNTRVVDGTIHSEVKSKEKKSEKQDEAEA